MSNPVGWFEIHVKDMARAKAFYAGVLGLVFTRLDSPDPGTAMEMWAFPMDQAAYGAAGALVQMPGLAAGGSGTLVYFSCADCAIEAARAVPHGGQLLQAKTAIGPYGHIALLLDSEGNRIGLHSMQ